MQELRYERPATVAEAIECLSRDGARALAGGTDLIPQVREGRRNASTMVDLKHIAELTSLERRDDGSWKIGAAQSIGRLGGNRAFSTEHASLIDAARLIGSLQIQNRATLGGNLCNAAPSADAIPLMIALGAHAEIAGPSAGGVAKRQVHVEDIPTAPGRSMLAPGELLVAIVLPPHPDRSASRYLRFTPRREMDIAVAGSAVRLELDARGMISAARIVLASVAPVPLQATQAAQLLIGGKPSATLFTAAGAKAAEESCPISDTRGSAGYRRELVAVLTRRALADCASRLGVQLQ